MRRFLSPRIPPLERVLLVESGSRRLYENLLPGLYSQTSRVDLLTCFAGLPDHFRESSGRVYRTAEYPGSSARRALYRELSRNNYSTLGIICSGEPIMTRWKWAAVAQVPAKVFILNENGDYFWLDRANWRTALHFIAFRSGLSGAGAVTTLARVLVFPVTLLYLLLFAAFVHIRRKVLA
jgi:hypothetical protein